MPSPPVMLIPAYQPGQALVGLVQALAAAGMRVVVVDDGSGPGSRDYFSLLQGTGQTTVLHHAVNLGKGAALKTGLNHIACSFPDCLGVVTVDADGQHRPEDALAVAQSLAANPASLVLGVRRFEGRVPLRSRIGNALTRLVMRVATGQRVTDTQTGLRGIPLWLVPRLLRLPSQGYEFELDMLLACKYEGVRVMETPIASIYLEDNRASHFDPLWDSLRIYFVLLRFAISSLLSALLDDAVFIVVFLAWPSILGAQVCGRILATAFNYLANKTTVFRSTARNWQTLPRYLALVLVSGAIGYGLIRLLVSRAGIDVIPAKIGVETVLFLFNFAVQRDFIFPRAE